MGREVVMVVKEAGLSVEELVYRVAYGLYYSFVLAVFGWQGLDRAERYGGKVSVRKWGGGSPEAGIQAVRRQEKWA